mmetsp:Transcript_36290/g.115476  ORF Transcript_36290/g.115476 Transcript_36290/m.115476 type:complete len:443 (-) Transcript_36290:104-1432(-)
MGADEGNDQLQGVYQDGHVVFRFIFVHVLMNDFVFAMAVLLILQWHVMHAFSAAPWMQDAKAALGMPRRNVRRMGLNLLILQIYFSPGMPLFVQHRKFVLSVLLTIFETVVLYNGMIALANSTVEVRRKRLSTVAAESLDAGLLEAAAAAAAAEAEAEPPAEEADEVMPAEEADEERDPRWDENPDIDGGADDLTASMYMDLTVGFHSILPIFVIQLALVAFYINELNDPKSDTKDASNAQYGYWLVAVIIQLYASEQQLGTAWNRKYWKKVLTFDPRQTTTHVAKQTLSLYGKVETTYRTEWTMRSYMDYAVNSLARDLIMFTFPIMLCVEGPLDFVKDCTAVFFMTTLDDTGFEKAKTIAQMMVRLKFNIYYEHLRDTSGADLDIPLKFTAEEAKSAEFDPMVWDQFELQRGYKSPHIPGKSVLDYMMEMTEPAPEEDAA